MTISRVQTILYYASFKELNRIGKEPKGKGRDTALLQVALLQVERTATPLGGGPTPQNNLLRPPPHLAKKQKGHLDEIFVKIRKIQKNAILFSL